MAGGGSPSTRTAQGGTRTRVDGQGSRTWSTIGPSGTPWRINQYVEEGTEAFDDLYPMRRPRHPFERILSWLSGFKFLHDCALTSTSLGRAPLEWSPPPWLEGSEFGRILGWIV
jgi:hypothetical protein